MRLSILLLSLLITLGATSCTTYVSARTPKKTVVRIAPKQHKLVVIKGKRYYFWNGKHYKKTRHGFVVVRV